MEIFIRQITEKDAEAITTLCGQLGYSLSLEQTLQNTRAVMENKDHDAFVAIHANKVIGWIGVAQAIQIETPAFCEIRGLVVGEQYRKQGVGKILIERAKRWGKERGNNKLRLRCNIKRTETHRFYLHFGFLETKQQKVFEISLDN